MTRRNWLVFAAMLIAASALALSGCGGDDNGGLSAEDMARIDNAEAAAASAMAAQAEAEAEAAAAMAAQMEAEAEAAAAMAAQMEAEAEAAAAMAAQATAEMNATAAIAAQAVAEAAAATAMAAQMEAEDDLDAAEMALMTANEAKTAAETALAVAQSEAAAAKEAQMMANEAKMAAEAAQKEAEDKAEMYKEAAAEAEAAKMAAETALAEANARLAELEAPYDPSQPGGTLEGQEGRAAAQRIDDAAHTYEEKAVLEALNLPGGTPGLMGGASVDVEHGRLGYDPEVSVSVEGGSGLGTDDEDTVVVDAPEIDDFDGTGLSKDGPGDVSQMALVYTDIQPSVRAWGDVYRYNATVNASGVPAADGGTTPEASRTHLLVSATADQFTAILADDPRVSLMHGLSTQTGVLTRPIADGGTIRGSYDGVDGQYSFAGAGTLTLDSGDLTIAGSTIVAFRADDPDQLLPDRDYLVFGVWAEVPSSPTTANPGRVRPFVHGSASKFDIDNVNNLNGSAKYAGGAVGHYATRAKGDHMVTEGRFTAKASLTANFDAMDGAYDDDGDGGTARVDAMVTATGVVLTGKITDFESEDGMKMPGWLVNLKAGTMTPDLAEAMKLDAAEDTAATRMEAAFGEIDVLGTTDGTTGSQAFRGVWAAWMFGNNTANHPTGVAGNFQAEAGTAEPVATDEGRINLFADEGFAGVVGSFVGR